MLRRWIALLLLCWLPLQGAYALAASYCLHESGPVHLGHHEHHHDDAPAVHDDGDASRLGAAHADCAQCHHACPCVLPGMAAALMEMPPQAPPPADNARNVRHPPDPLEHVPLAHPLALA